MVPLQISDASFALADVKFKHQVHFNLACYLHSTFWTFSSLALFLILIHFSFTRLNSTFRR